jgi:hypothetical protein
MGKNAQQTSRGPAPALAVDVRSTDDSGGFSRSTMRHRDSLSATAAPKRCDRADCEAMRSADVSRHEAEIAIHLSRPEVLDVKLVRLGRMHLTFLPAKNTSSLTALRRALMNWSSIGS